MKVPKNLTKGYSSVGKTWQNFVLDKMEGGGERWAMWGENRAVAMLNSDMALYMFSLHFVLDRLLFTN